MKATTKQVYAPYTAWEDWQGGMYRSVRPSDFERLQRLAVGLLSSPRELQAAMQHAVDSWPVAAAVNLTNREQNHRPWLGQAACCLEHGCPEDVTRAAWNQLSHDVQRAANAAADRVFYKYLCSCPGAQLWLEFGECA